MRVLLTGGAGYIGSQLTAMLLADGHRVVVLDDLSTGSLEALRRAQLVSGRVCRFVHGSTLDPAAVRTALEDVDAVIHLAGFKSVSESMSQPARYHANNVGGMSCLLSQMDRAGVRRIVFSSSAAVYGNTDQHSISEDTPLAPESPYGHTKAIGEQLLQDLADRAGWAAISLRYFNPVGAHPSGSLGDMALRPDGLVPRMLRALTGGGPPLTIFGTDHPTADGTCERDFVHVWDLARAHALALRALDRPGHQIYNVGTGRPHSVREVIDRMGALAGRPVPFLHGPPRPGDVVRSLANPQRIRAALGFQSELGLDDMLASAWAWHRAPKDSRVLAEDIVEQQVLSA